MSSKSENTGPAASKSAVESPARFQPVAGSIMHVEFSVLDLEAAAKFYGAVFGWQVVPFQENEMYFSTPENAGPCGCIMRGAPAGSNSVLYVNVDDIAASLRKAMSLGATLAKPKSEIPGGHGFMAHFKAPDGNVFGLYART